MTRYVFDTNIVSLIIRHDTAALAHFRTQITAEDVLLGCPMVWYEVQRGLLVKAAHTQIKRFRELFSTFIWQDYTLSDWELAARLWAKRRQLGTPVSDADLMIAVFALNRDAKLVTNNAKDFLELGITVEIWSDGS